MEEVVFKISKDGTLTVKNDYSTNIYGSDTTTLLDDSNILDNVYSFNDVDDMSTFLFYLFSTPTTLTPVEVTSFQSNGFLSAKSITTGGDSFSIDYNGNVFAKNVVIDSNL